MATTYETLSDNELLDIIVSELIECDVVEMLHKAGRQARDIDERESYTAARIRIQAAIATYRERYPRDVDEIPF